MCVCSLLHPRPVSFSASLLANSTNRWCLRVSYNYNILCRRCLISVSSTSLHRNYNNYSQHYYYTDVPLLYCYTSDDKRSGTTTTYDVVVVWSLSVPPLCTATTTTTLYTTTMLINHYYTVRPVMKVYSVSQKILPCDVCWNFFQTCKRGNWINLCSLAYICERSLVKNSQPCATNFKEPRSKNFLTHALVQLQLIMLFCP